MMGNYQEKPLSANAYRIKELGDGFLCSVGFPFHCPQGNAADHAFDLSRRFVQIFKDCLAERSEANTLKCAVGIAQGLVVGSYPESGVQVYDLYGPAVVLATRYEAFRNQLGEKFKLREHVIIVQNRIFEELSLDQKALLRRFDLKHGGYRVRNDPLAEELYFRHEQERTRYQ